MPNDVKLRTDDDEHFIFATIQEAHDAQEPGLLKDKLMLSWLLMMRKPAIPSTVSGETEALAMARAVIADMVESGFIHSNERTGSGYYVGENVVPIIMGRASPANPAETQAVEVEE